MPRDIMAEKVARRWARGDAIEAIAKELGVSRRTVDKCRARLGLAPRARNEGERRRYAEAHVRSIERSNIIAHLIGATAKLGQPAPTNKDIGRILKLGDYADHSTLAAWLYKAVDRGLIVIERHPDTPQQRRRFLHVASGLWTDWTDMTRSSKPKGEIPMQPEPIANPSKTHSEEHDMTKLPPIGLAVTKDRAEAWLRTAPPGARLIYYVGDHLPAGRDPAREIAGLFAEQYKAGRVVLAQRKADIPGGARTFEYMAIRSRDALSRRANAR